MNQYFLRFADKDEALTVGAISANMADGEIVKQSSGYFINVVGIIPAIVEDAPAYDSDGALIDTETTYSTVNLDGYHVNVLINELPSGLLPYQIEVNTPYRKFAGY